MARQVKIAHLLLNFFCVAYEPCGSLHQSSKRGSLCVVQFESVRNIKSCVTGHLCRQQYLQVFDQSSRAGLLCWGLQLGLLSALKSWKGI